jgi:hypothetical protein
MTASVPSTAAKPRASAWKWFFRVFRWSTYAAAIITLLLVLHKAAPPLVETSPQAAARAEEKIEQAGRSVASGAPATLRLDETELNSYLATHLELGGDPANPGAAGDEPSVEQVRSSVRDVKIELVGDQVRAYVVFDVHGKDLSLRLEGKLRAAGGYLQFEPTGGAIGAFSLPRSALEHALRRVMDSPENREKFRLPATISDLRIENGEMVVSYK